MPDTHLYSYTNGAAIVSAKCHTEAPEHCTLRKEHSTILKLQSFLWNKHKTKKD